MQQPSFIPIPFAENGNKDAIPLTKQATGRASWNTGFPPETSLPQGAGGYAPMRTDFQGVLYELSAHIFFGQSGNLYAWDATLDYNAWAHVLDTDENNVTREYIAVAQNGPTTSNVTRPYQDVNYTCWKPITLFMTDYVYPVGSIYMTTSAMNPGTIFGGTWAKIENRFLIGASGTYSVGTTGGSTTQTLTTTNIPSHTHTVTTGNSTNTPTITIAAKTVTANTGNQSQPHTHSVTFPAKTFSNATNSTGAHTHTRGSMDITGKFSGVGEQYDGVPNTLNGAFYRVNTKKDPSQGVPLSNSGNKDDYFGFEASRSWTGSTSSNGNHQHSVTIPATSMTVGNNSASHTHSVSLTVPSQTVNVASYTHNHSVTVGNTGGGSAFSIVPPYYAVYIWRRTA